jgi:cation:H+ antiporter
MLFLPHFLPLPVALSLFIVSLAFALGASAWFTTRLERICDLFDLSPSLLSLLGALGANIPNYVASIVAIASGSITVGLGIIVGSNIYNIAIILSLATLLATKHSIHLAIDESGDVLQVGRYTLLIMLAALVSTALLAWSHSASTFLGMRLLPLLLLLLTNIATICVFALLARHAMERVPHSEAEKQQEEALLAATPPSARVRTIAEALLALLVALGAVVLMVQAGQDVATDVRMSPVILGLVVLAIATSLPNTVVASILARTGRATACVEEVLRSNSINATLGIALPLLIWQGTFGDRALLLLDVPLMVLLTLSALLAVRRRHLGPALAILLIVVYVAWIGVHLIL